MTTKDKKQEDKAAPAPAERDVYKRQLRRGKRTAVRASHNLTELMVGVTGAVADSARAFGEAMRRDDDQMNGPTDVVEATALGATRMFEGLAATWKSFHENLQRDHAATDDEVDDAPPPAPAIDYEKLADMVAARVNKPAK